MHGGKQMIKLKISEADLRESLEILKGSPDKEKVILWLGKKEQDAYLVQEVFTPIQITEEDHFTIPPEGMAELMQKLRSTRKMLVAQVHTHPFEAYHSLADDKWAIVRHVNAYSIVVPWFCSTTVASNFIENAASYVLSSSNEWVETINNNIIIYELGCDQ